MYKNDAPGVIWFDQVMHISSFFNLNSQHKKCPAFSFVAIFCCWKPEAHVAQKTDSTATERLLFKQKNVNEYTDTFYSGPGFSTKSDYLRKALTIKVQVHVDKNYLFQLGESLPIKGGDVEKVLVVSGTKKICSAKFS